MPTYSRTQLKSIYDRTTGCCHLCHKKLAFTNYAYNWAKGAWEVEHSRPRARGGSEHPNNLYPACVSCNRSKRDGSTRAARARHGHTRAPLSRGAAARQRSSNAVVGTGIGAAVGGIIGGPPGAALGGFIGALFGDSMKVK